MPEEAPENASPGQTLRNALNATAIRISPSPRRADRSRIGVQLGHEPPIQLENARGDGRHRRIPLRWMLGVALTGFSGLALIGSALYLDLDRQSNFAQAPEFANAPRKETNEEAAVNPGKGDRLVQPIDIVAAKQSFKSIMTIKIGDKEVLKARPYTLLSTNLTTTPTSFASQVPPFDPLKSMNASAQKGEAPIDLGPAQDDSESAFASRDITSDEVGAARGELTVGEAQAQVAEWAKAQAAGERLSPIPPQMLLMRTSRAGVEALGALSYATTGLVTQGAPFSQIEVRMVPENVTNAPRTTPDGNGISRRRLAQLRHGQPFEDLLRENGASREVASVILAAFGLKHGESPVAEGQKVIFDYDEKTASERAAPIARVSVYSEEQLKAIVALNDEGAYVPITVSKNAAPPAKPKSTDDDGEGGLSLYSSLYETALKQGLPRPIIDDIVRAFANDVDFQRSVQPGDGLVAFMQDGDEIETRPQLLYATLTAREQTFKYYRFQTPDDNLVDFYDENGRSTRKFLIRKPIVAGEITSGFGMRYHPILRYSRMHTGVDWGAPIGTPILAAGNGVIIKAAYDSGYGRRVEIQHANGYVTTYNHMSGFGRGIVEGLRVTQGQVIGYLGQSGLATGPHLHYEVVINGNFVDPMAIKLARTREFDGRMLGLFRKERDRVDGLMGQAPNASAAAPGPTAKLN